MTMKAKLQTESLKRVGRESTKILSGPILGHVRNGIPGAPVTVERHSQGYDLIPTVCPYCGSA